MKRIFLLGNCLLFLVLSARTQTISKEQFLQWFDDNKNLFHENESLEDDFTQINLDKLREDPIVKKQVISLLDFENKIQYKIRDSKRKYLGNDSVFFKISFSRFLKQRGLSDKEDSIIKSPGLYKQYMDSALRQELMKIEIEIRKSFENIDMKHKGWLGGYKELSRSVILLQGFMRYPESYDSLKKWLRQTPKFVDKEDVIVALAQMGDKAGIHAYSNLVDSLMVVANQDSKFVATKYFNEKFATDLRYINRKETWLNFLKIFDLESRYNNLGYGQNYDARYYILDGRVSFLCEQLNDGKMKAYWGNLQEKLFKSKKLFTREELLPIKKWIMDNINYFLR
ncbi:MAG: hypothetical protein CRN43_15235 [Candidatus Nephrothrix sp. EaCA]|nr:MAG: hypothetical protein CRN43_15235 [Candidatus Nephrothrix sp. EaCA]